MEHLVAVLMINFAVVVAAQNQVSLALSDYENLEQIVLDAFTKTFAPNIPLVLEAHRLIREEFVKGTISNIHPTTQFMAEVLLYDSVYFTRKAKFLQEGVFYYGFPNLFDDTFKKMGMYKDELEFSQFAGASVDSQTFDDCYAIHAKPTVDVFAAKLKAKLDQYSPRLISMYNTSLPKVIQKIASNIGEVKQKITASRTPEIAAREIIKRWHLIRETLLGGSYASIWTLIYDGIEKLGARVQNINEELNLEMGGIKSVLQSCLNIDPSGSEMSISQDQVPLAFSNIGRLGEIARDAVIKVINATFPSTREVFRLLREDFIMGRIFNIHPSAQMAAALLDESVRDYFIYFELSLSPIDHGYYLDQDVFSYSLTQLGIGYNRYREVTFNEEVVDTQMLNGCYLIHGKPIVDALASTLEAKLNQYSPKWIAMFNSSFTKVNEKILNEIATLQQKIDEYKTPETALRGIVKQWPSLRDKFRGFPQLVENVFENGKHKLWSVVQHLLNLKFGDTRSAMESCMTIDVVASMSTTDPDELTSTSLTP